MTDTLVIYYSFTGNAKKVANYVKEKKNADIFSAFLSFLLFAHCLIF